MWRGAAHIDYIEPNTERPGGAYSQAPGLQSIRVELQSSGDVATHSSRLIKPSRSRYELVTNLAEEIGGCALARALGPLLARSPAALCSEVS